MARSITIIHILFYPITGSQRLDMIIPNKNKKYGVRRLLAWTGIGSSWCEVHWHDFAGLEVGMGLDYWAAPASPRQPPLILARSQPCPALAQTTLSIARVSSLPPSSSMASSCSPLFSYIFFTRPQYLGFRLSFKIEGFY
jgi:hypothetical protein